MHLVNTVNTLKKCRICGISSGSTLFASLVSPFWDVRHKWVICIDPIDALFVQNNRNRLL